jgi:hypothetical protein
MTHEESVELSGKIVDAAIAGEPVEVSKLVGELLVEKCASEVMDRKQKVAKKMLKNKEKDKEAKAETKEEVEVPEGNKEEKAA